MFRSIALLAVLSVSVQAGGYGGGLGGGFGGFGGGSASLAVNTHHSVSYVPVPSSGPAEPTTVTIQSQSAPINFLARSSSSPITVQHVHIPTPGSFRETSSQDEPHVRVHTVTRPIIQEIREIIAPQRFIRQQVLPVQEEIQTIVARGVDAGVGGSFGGGFGGSRGFGGNFRR